LILYSFLFILKAFHFIRERIAIVSPDFYNK